MAEPDVFDGLPGRMPEERAMRTALHETGVDGPRTLALTGPAGVGKTALLRGGAALARSLGFQVITAEPGAAGAERALLAALLEAGARLPEEVRRPLARRVMGAPRAPGPVALRLAVLAAVETLAGRGPVLILLDDLAPDDRETLSLLTFVTRRLTGRPVVVLIASRTVGAFGALHDEITMLPVPPLRPTAAAGLLDAMPEPPVGRVRAEILRLGGGNPGVLIRLAEAAATSVDAFGRDFRLPLEGPLADTLDRLPAATRRLLLVAAAAEDGDLGTILAAARAGLPDCRPAEEAGLISVMAVRVGFPDPMIRVLCYFSAEPSARRAAHAALVSALPLGAPLRDWHAAQVLGAGDAAAAPVFERAAAAAVTRGSGLAAAAILEQGAEHSRADRDAARLFGRAATEADRSGDLAWAQDLARRMLARGGDRAEQARTAAALGNSAMFRSGRWVLGRLDRLLPAPPGDPELVPPLLSLAARAVLSDGRPADVATLRRLINRSVPDRRGSHPVFTIALADAVADPAGWPARYGNLRDSPLMEPVVGPAERSRLLSVAGIAWVTDEAEIAADYYRRALARSRDDQAYGVSALSMVVFAEVLLERGLLDEAAAGLRDATDFVGGNGSALVGRALNSQQASLLLRQGAVDEARILLARDATPGPADSRLVRCLRLRATGQLAAARGDDDEACTAYLQMFEPDGSPVHHLMSQRSVVGLAAAALAAGRRAEAEKVLQSARSRAPRPTGRREWSWRVATALLRPDDERAGRLTAALLADRAAADRWPHEYATAEAAFAHRLRAGRRPSEARPRLVSALDIFVRVGARQDAALVQERLRAVGIRRPEPGESLLAGLTPQQQLIARLAADGLSNREISGRLRIAPRTVGFHLYQIFPKLGIARRGQLRDLVATA